MAEIKLEFGAFADWLRVHWYETFDQNDSYCCGLSVWVREIAQTPDVAVGCEEYWVDRHGRKLPAWAAKVSRMCITQEGSKPAYTTGLEILQFMRELPAEVANGN